MTDTPDAGRTAPQDAEPDAGAPATDAEAGAAAPARPLSAAARRALAEAAERRAALDARAAGLAVRREVDGRDGPEPVRYGDWEVKGIASDF